MATLTIRRISDALKARLRVQAAEHGVSMEEEVRRILHDSLAAKEIGRHGSPAADSRDPHPLDVFISTWVEDPVFDEVIASFDNVDEAMWE